MTQLIQERILRLKQEKNACILAHCYQTHDILEVADYVGDSFGLAQNASKTDCSTVIMCGVRFMAETVKILSPEKRVLLPKAEAGCPMAEQLDPEMLRQLQAAYPDYTTVAYINTTAELKTLCDVCVTSSSAVKIIRNMDAEKILFIPDCNLGDYISKQVPEKQFQLIHGGCPTHVRMTRDDVLRARAAHPNALLLVHPECRPQVTEMADFVGSTTEIMHYAENSDAREFIIGTENSIVQHLGISHPEKLFYALSKDCVCHNMKVTTIADVLHCLEGTDGEEILLEESVRLRAKKSIDEMIRLGK
ncbi:quinolinate synthase NadA [Ruminococcus callidus]|uniref:quinolinate synthase NadA n=1 Tax=Ruminococcus TaxID=1263 RepID=UPI001D022A06|nr:MULTISPECIES: quinolinate synthase NadA [Ruminococcus]MCB5776186.1 quinolinate synthase NadA [Ruminococcus callidus]MCC2759920.1 quinolinate synthase NadA [Ruminococcus callidus]